MGIEQQLADYVIILDDAAAESKKLGDRPLYEKYRAHAGLMLALAVQDPEQERLNDEIDAHEHLWTHSWLTDNAYKKPAEAWQTIADAWMKIRSSR
jgi:hypothetical protein